MAISLASSDSRLVLGLLDSLGVMPTQHSLREATKRLAIRSNHVVDIGSTVIQHWEANAT